MPTRWGVFVWGASSRRGLAERSSPQNIDYGLRKTLNRNERTAVSLARDEGTDLDEFPAIAFDEPVKARARFEKWPSVVVEPIPHTRVVSQSIGIHVKLLRCATTATKEFSDALLPSGYSATARFRCRAPLNNGFVIAMRVVCVVCSTHRDIAGRGRG